MCSPIKVPGSIRVLWLETCKLAARAWARPGRFDASGCTYASAATVGSLPIDTIETDRLCFCWPTLSLFDVSLEKIPVKPCLRGLCALKDKVDLCTVREFCGVEATKFWDWRLGICAGCEAIDSFRRPRLEAEVHSSGLSDEIPWVAEHWEIFLKVIWHSMSSPAKTVEFFHCTNTRMFDILWARNAEGLSACRNSWVSEIEAACQNF